MADALDRQFGTTLRLTPSGTAIGRLLPIVRERAQFGLLGKPGELVELRSVKRVTVWSSQIKGSEAADRQGHAGVILLEQAIRRRA